MNSDVSDFPITEMLFRPDTERRILRLAEEKAVEYQTAEPFPHIVIDDFLPVEPLENALKDFPNPREIRWKGYDGEHERKFEYNSAERLENSVRSVLYFLNSPITLEFLETLTGIKGLISDPYFIGGGLHQSEVGGFLNIHADFNKLTKLNLDRRLNLIIYLNKDWKEEYGGHLELWDRDMKSCAKRILPVFNRCVIFSTTDHSFHGHPIPLTCPKDVTRKSIATYYYTNGRPAEEVTEKHSTLFQQRPDSPALGRNFTRKAKKIALSLTPPILLDTYYKLRFPKDKK